MPSDSSSDTLRIGSDSQASSSSGSTITTDVLDLGLSLDQLKIQGQDLKCYIWARETKLCFEAWWLTTAWHKDNQSATKNRRKITWNSPSYKAEQYVFFEEGAAVSTGEPRMICKRCFVTLGHPACGNGTSSMSKHLDSAGCRKSSKRKGLSQLQLGPGYRAQCAQKKLDQILSPNPHLSVNDFDRQFVRWIIATGSPMRIADHIETQRMIRCLNRDINIPTASTVKNHIMKRITEIETSLPERIPITGKVSLALDLWSASNRQSYLGIVAYYIDEQWTYHNILIGFEYLEGAHTGERIASTVIEVLRKFSLEDRIFAITTDNASNNDSCMRAIDSTMQGSLSHEFNHPDYAPFIQHIPCLAHIIQLSLKALLSNIKASPQNEEIQKNWYGEEDNDEIGRESQDIPRTLAKIRKTAVFINASGKRVSSFRDVQTARLASQEPENLIFEDPERKQNIQRRPLKLLQDVKTRWDSTYYMMRRAYRLQDDINTYLREYHSGSPLILNAEEWKQIAYLIELVQPFCILTQTISRTIIPTVHQVFHLYNHLFNHLDKATARLRRKRVGWKTEMLAALEDASEKLRTYYAQTQDSLGNLYGKASLLNPLIGDTLFRSKEWAVNEGEIPWDEKYWEALYDDFLQYQDKAPILQNGPSSQTLYKSVIQDLDSLLNTTSQPLEENRPLQNEFNWYRTQSPFTHFKGKNILEQWKELQSQCPILATLARDILGAASAEVGCERIFSIAGRLYNDHKHYEPNTFRALMMVQQYDAKENSETILRLTEEAEGDSAGTLYEASIIEDDLRTVLTYISDEDEELITTQTRSTQRSSKSELRNKGKRKAADLYDLPRQSSATQGSQRSFRQCSTSTMPQQLSKSTGSHYQSILPAYEKSQKVSYSQRIGFHYRDPGEITI